MAHEERFSAVRKLLESCGWELARIKGSHHVFTKAGELPVSLPVHKGKVKATYVRIVEKICQKDDES